MKNLNIIFAASECSPFAKTGGMADVIPALSKELSYLGHNVYIFLPFYKNLYNFKNIEIINTNITSNISIGTDFKQAFYYHTKLPETNVQIILIKNDEYFFRDSLYTFQGKDYSDNFDRFLFFCKAIINFILIKELKIDIIHCNDWQTAFIPFLLKLSYKNEFLLNNTKTIFTIHNFSYQGIFEINNYYKLNLPWEYFTSDKFEYYGKINLLKSALVFSDIITTVSPTYRNELLISKDEISKGLTYFLQMREKDFYGILNGVDYSIWNPEIDKYLIANYSAKNLTGKKLCKKDLLKITNLKGFEKPLFIMISRLVNMKGLDILIDSLDTILSFKLNFVLLGDGAPDIEKKLKDYSDKYKNFKLFLKFDDELAHKMYAGGDFLIMPSKSEPCGLNQLYALKYGTIPIVHSTGGLSDTIIDYFKDYKNGTGFAFYNYSSKNLIDIIEKCVILYKNKNEINKIIKRAMKQDFSWKNSAKKYLELYYKILS
jgi:starch synthase